MITDDIPREALTHLQEPTGLNFAQEASADANVPTQGAGVNLARKWPVKGFKEGFCRLASGVRCFLGLALVVLLVSSPGCATRRASDWYNGPAELKEPVRQAVNLALAELPPEVGRPLRWDWNRNRINVRVVDPVGMMYGEPYIISPSGNRVTGLAYPSSITLPRGFKLAALRHEVGHVVLFANGKHGDHHIYPFFDRH
jgi:hypothetical protein